MLCIWWDQKGIVYYVLLNPNETVTADRYERQLDKLSNALIQKRPLIASKHHKVSLADTRFRNAEEVRKWVDDWIVSKDEDFFRRGINKLPERVLLLIRFSERESDLILERYVDNYEIFHHARVEGSRIGVPAKRRFISRLTEDINAMRVAKRTEKQIEQKLVMRIKSRKDMEPHCRCIDIWWVVMDGGILMLIAYLLKQHKVWRGCTLRIFAIGDNDPSKNEEIRKGLQKYIYMLRIDADVFVGSLKLLVVHYFPRYFCSVKKVVLVYCFSTMSTGKIEHQPLDHLFRLAVSNHVTSLFV
nr:unnamed protein product [Haemonchus contortus]